MKHLWYCLLLSIVFISCGKSGPTDEQLKDLCRNVGFAARELNDTKAEEETFWKMAKESEANYDLQKISPEQIDLLFATGGGTLATQLREWLAPVLKNKKDESTTFAYYYWKYLPENSLSISDEKINAYKNLISRKDLAEWMETKPDAAAELVDGAAEIKGDKWLEFGIVPHIKALLTYPLPANAIEQTVKVFNTGFSSEQLPLADKEDIRKQVLKLYQELVQQTTSPSQKKRAGNQIAYLQSAFATGTLIGNKAPELHFRWISNGNEKSLDDFKGKVVMLDFWATKCAPCVASFPEIAELQNHYKNSPVAIIGVTSIQGYFVDIPNKTTVNTAHNPEKEIGLVPAYMKSMGINWRIAFSEEDVMNVDYGVLAIPHVTLIDKQGRVRYNNITATNEEKIKLIDSLLNE